VTLAATYDLGDAYQLRYVLTPLNTAFSNWPAVTLSVTVTKPDGTPADPPAVTGPVTTSNPATGTWLISGGATQPGTWAYAITAAGVLDDVADGTFFVEEADRADVYATVPELRHQIGDEQGTVDPGRLAFALRVVSRAIDERCGQRFWRDPPAAPTTRRYRPVRPSLLRVAPFASLTGLVVTAGGSLWTAGSDFDPEPLDAAADGGAYRWYQLAARGSTFPAPDPGVYVSVTAIHGWSAVPDQIREAALLKAAALYRRREAPFGIAGFTEFGPVRITRADPDVADLLAGFTPALIR
jgi:hypothetical protein